MKGSVKTHYYKATGFTPYYFAHVIFNVVHQHHGFLRKVEDIFGCIGGESLTQNFPKHSSLHIFIEAVLLGLFYESPENDDTYLIMDFVQHVGKQNVLENFNDIDEYYEASIEAWFREPFDEFVEEIFHILFSNVAFLEQFNWMTTSYLQRWLESDLNEERKEHFNRVTVPQFAKDAIYFRDQGECRACKVVVDRSVSPKHKEHYDHIVPLSRYGSNDITNLQLLCPKCNLSKSNHEVSTSSDYPRAYPA